MLPATDPVPSVAFDPTHDEIAAVHRVWAERKYGPAGAWLGRHGGKLLLGLLGGLLLLGRSWFLLAPLILVLGGAGLYLRLLRKQQPMVMARAARARGLVGTYEVYVDDDALLLRGPGDDVSVPWRAVSLHEEPHGGVILDLPHTRLPVPVRAFEDDLARHRFVSTVRARLASPPVPPATAPDGASFVLDEREHYAVGLEPLRGLLVLAPLALLAGSHVLVAAVAVWRGASVDTLAPLLVSLLGWVALLVGPTLLFTTLAVRTRRSSPTRAAPTTVRLGVDGIQFAGAAISTIPWRHVHGLRVRPRGLVVRFEKVFTLVPRRAFPDEAAFGAFAAEAKRLWGAGRRG